MNNLKKVSGYLGCFVLGIVFTITTTPVISAVGELLFGFEIQSMASFPYYHMAKLYTSPGLGDQTLTLKVDGNHVWTSGDAAGGDLNEKLIWDKTGHILTLELNGENVLIYDAQNQKIKYKR